MVMNIFNFLMRILLRINDRQNILEPAIFFAVLRTLKNPGSGFVIGILASNDQSKVPVPTDTVYSNQLFFFYSAIVIKNY